MIVIIILLAVFSTQRYATKLNSKLIQTKFDWNKEVEINLFKNLEVDSISYNYLKVKGLDAAYQPDNQNTFSLNEENGQKYYFRFINFDQNGDEAIFWAIEWLTGVPDFPENKVSITESNIPLEINKGKSVVTIGNELLVKDEAKYFRRRIASIIDVNFEGRAKDVFNYKHEAVYSEDWQLKFSDVKSIPEGDIYILFGGFPNEVELNDSLENQLNSFLKELANRTSTEKIIWILLPNVKDEKENLRRSEINQFLRTLKDEKLELLEANSIFQEERNEYVMPDSIHLNKYGYEKLANETVELLK